MKNNNWNKKELYKLYHIEGKTLEEIGILHTVSRERIRQVMSKFNIPRNRNQSQVIIKNKGTIYNGNYDNLEDYLSSYSGKHDWGLTINKYTDKLFCSECGRGNTGDKHTNLHIHHIVYPATSLNDIQVLCASCHFRKHKSGITFAQQLDIYNAYCNGITTIDLAIQYNISRISIYKILAKIKNGHKALKR